MIRDIIGTWFGGSDARDFPSGWVLVYNKIGMYSRHGSGDRSKQPRS
jgi:hypothetical protein